MPSSCGEMLRDAVLRLEAITDTPRLDAELLLAAAQGWSRSELLRRLREPGDSAVYESLLARRLQQEPIAYILGDCEFYSLNFRIRPPVLIPRPETEHLVETALAYKEGRPSLSPFRVLDLCTGSGCIACTLAHEAPDAQVTATDLMPHAVALARENARRLGLAVTIGEGDLFAALPAGEAPFEVIVSNPPYVADAEWDTLARDIRDYEDVRALLAGADGLDLVRRIIADAPDYLCPGGLLAMEIGEDQYPAVADLLGRRGFTAVAPVRDLAGINRIATGRWPDRSHEDHLLP